MKNIRLAGIVKESIVDGPGIRYTIFTQGCHHHCLGCHNPETHDVTKGYDKDIDELVADIKSNKLLDGVTFSGGDPIIQAEACLEIVQKLKQTTSLNYILYTGYKFEELLELSNNKPVLKELLNNIDYLIDGKFVQSLRDLSLNFRGSSNQRIINTRKSLLKNEVVIEEI